MTDLKKNKMYVYGENIIPMIALWCPVFSKYMYMYV